MNTIENDKPGAWNKDGTINPTNDTRVQAGAANLPLTEPMLQFFAWEHLPAGKLQVTSILFFELAHKIVSILPRNPERTVALRKLLEAKDAAVRTNIYKAN